MADSWKAEVEKQMEGQKEIIPLLLSGFYTLAPTGFDFGEKDSRGKHSIPWIQKLLNTPPIFADVNKYLNIKQDENSLDMKPARVFRCAIFGPSVWGASVAGLRALGSGNLFSQIN
jgi:hypothetical protein